MSDRTPGRRRPPAVRMRAPRVLAPALLAAGLAAGSAGPALACSTESYLGQVCVLAIDYCPAGTLKAAGQTLSISQYRTLFTLLGNRFGGDGRTTFQLPDLGGVKDPTPVPLTRCIVVDGLWPPR